MITFNEMVDNIKSVTLPFLKENGIPTGHTRLMMSNVTKTLLEYHLDGQNFNPKPVSTVYGFTIGVDDRLEDNEFTLTTFDPTETRLPFDDTTGMVKHE